MLVMVISWAVPPLYQVEPPQESLAMAAASVPPLKLALPLEWEELVWEKAIFFVGGKRAFFVVAVAAALVALVGSWGPQVVYC